ncbi:rRNA maturation RNase YbeY [Candidatus Peregrinibacteria bacterium]|nr:rRNA maturation RNase YbeY [Candidatus Peregrinibacteria bacterium]
MKLNIYNNAKQKISEDFFQEIFSASLNQLQVDYSEYEKFVISEAFFINLILVDNEEIQNLNKEWREKDSVTDVLSFPYFLASDLVSQNLLHLNEGGAETECFGEIYICIPRAKIQAENLKHSFKKELIILFAHGILHIFAFNHISDEDFLVMNALEKKIEKRLSDLI